MARPARKKKKLSLADHSRCRGSHRGGLIHPEQQRNTSWGEIREKSAGVLNGRSWGTGKTTGCGSAGNSTFRTASDSACTFSGDGCAAFGRTQAAASKGPAEPPVKNAPKPVALRTASLNGIRCKLIDASRPAILLSLSLVFPENTELEREILMKRDDLKVLVQKTMASKSLDDMVKDSLGKDIRSALNALLENGAITNVEFKEFMIDKAE